MSEYFAQFVAVVALAIAIAGVAFMVATMRATITDLRAQLDREYARSQTFADIIVDMKVAGGVAQRLAPLPAGVKLEQPRRSDVDQAIDENKHASANPALRKWLAQWAERELRRGDGSERDRHRVLDELRTWSNVDDTDDDDDEDDQGTIAIEQLDDDEEEADARR